MAKKRREDPATSLAAKLRAEYKNWNKYYTEGGSDPCWPDGTNLELIRNHIIYAKMQCEELLTPDQYPEEYHWALPPKVKQSYMARADEIRQNALMALRAYKADKNFQYILTHYNLVSKKSQFQNILGYVKTLEIAIARDDLVVMRRHERPDLYTDAFASGRKELQKVLAKEQTIRENAYEQLSLFV